MARIPSSFDVLHNGTNGAKFRKGRRLLVVDAVDRDLGQGERIEFNDAAPMDVATREDDLVHFTCHFGTIEWSEQRPLAEFRAFVREYDLRRQRCAVVGI